ncbi:MAG: type II toxin-antitoxin system prevent-host-death family antitoxin [Victivallales bacterium]|nr:type II toxin-antitoxin system prevent-host-death family antitoxin [Victivallales bacterium]
MVKTTEIQTIVQDGKPAFVVIPYSEYVKMQREVALAVELNDNATFPLEITEMHILKKYSLPKAWRIYRHLTQKQMAEKMGITQGAYSQIEKSNSNQVETLRRLAKALDCTPAQLTMD